MDKKDIAIISSVITKLDESTQTSWSTGYFEDWTAYARKMKNTISTAIPDINGSGPRTLTKRLAQEQNWSIDYAARVVIEYKKFMMSSLSVPSPGLW